jgi:hypothetical protein
VTDGEVGLLARMAGVIFSPRETFAAVVARPRWFGVLAISVVIVAAATFFLLSTETGKQQALDQNVRTLEAFGQTVTDEMYAQIERGIENARYTGAASVLVVTPLFMALSAGLMHVIFGMVGGGNGTFKQVYAIVAHCAVITAIQQIFTVSLTIARGEPAGANLGVFVPMLDETSFVLKFLEAIDLFIVWSTFVTAIGLSVLYKRRTSSIATVLFGIYAVIALIIAFFRSGS